jgi:hypothetical protein
LPTLKLESLLSDWAVDSQTCVVVQPLLHCHNQVSNNALKEDLGALAVHVMTRFLRLDNDLLFLAVVKGMSIIIIYC